MRDSASSLTTRKTGWEVKCRESNKKCPRKRAARWIGKQRLNRRQHFYLHQTLCGGEEGAAQEKRRIRRKIGDGKRKRKYETIREEREGRTGWALITEHLEMAHFSPKYRRFGLLTDPRTAWGGRRPAISPFFICFPGVSSSCRSHFLQDLIGFASVESWSWICLIPANELWIQILILIGTNEQRRQLICWLRLHNLWAF